MMRIRICNISNHYYNNQNNNDDSNDVVVELLRLSNRHLESLLFSNEHTNKLRSMSTTGILISFSVS